MRLRKALLAALTLTLVTALWPGLALAHSNREVSGHKWNVGFNVEPAIVNVKNGVELRVREHSGEPLKNLDKELQAEVTHTATGVKKVFPLRAVFNDPGHYVADFIPTAPGQYQFRFFGTQDGQPVNETFVSGPNSFSDVLPAADLEFPKPLPDPIVLDQRVTVLESAGSGSGTALGIIGIVVGALGVAAGGAALTRRRRS
jgi:hypothetical protein